MIYAWIVTIVMALIYMGFSADKSKEEWARIAFLLIVSATWMLYFMLVMDKSFVPEPSYLNLMLLPIIGAAVWYLRRETYTPAPGEILADQISYWPIKAEEIRKHYSYRLKEKKDRIEVVADYPLKFWRWVKGRKILTANLFIDISRFDNKHLTVIKDPSDLNMSKLYSVIYARLVEIIEYKEIVVDYKKVLRANGYYAEFYLMYLWENYTDGINIGTGNLEVLATRNIEKKLIYALDNMQLQCLKRYGMDLYIAYMNHHNRWDSNE